jgi:hypothetical protein
MPMVVWSHNMMVSRAIYFTPFYLLFGAEAVLPTKIKHWRLRTAVEALACPNEAEKTDLLEPNRLKVVTNLQKYQDKTRSWRDPKVKNKRIRCRRPSPFTEPSHGELQKARVKMGWTIRGHGENKDRGLPSHGPLRQEAGAFMECRQPLLFLCLISFVRV